LHDIVVPVTQNHVAHGFQDFCSLCVCYRSDSMLPTVEFDEQMSIRAKEIDNKSVDWELPSEFPACKPAITQAKP